MAELKVQGKETYNEEDNFSSKMEGQRIQCREKIILRYHRKRFAHTYSIAFQSWNE